MKNLPECQLILDKLKNELPEHLHYHSVYHTLDVYNAAINIAEKEGLTAADLKLLLIAAIYHDAGYLIEDKKHEKHSCEIARKYLPEFQYSKEHIDIICDIIMATKLPHKPQSHLQEIICDADLDYLGRTDFFIIGDKLYHEMLAIGTLKNREEWDRLQVEFLEQHRFFTSTSIKLRKAEKEKNLKIVQSKIK